jgi:hypothetical protein
MGKFTVHKRRAIAMNSPSVKAIYAAFQQWISLEDAKRIKAIMDGPRPAEGTRLQAIDKILGTHGVEYTPPGHNAKSPAICYCNAGDTYATTILKVRGRFRIGTWGDLVERGHYD